MSTPIEIDTAPPANTFRRFVWDVTKGMSYVRAYWSRRLAGVVLGLIADSIAEAANQSVFARLPGHPQQAPDSLARVGLDRDLNRFRGETDGNWLARVRAAWDDYEQGGSDIQLMRVVNQWGAAGWPATWIPITSISESVNPLIFEFTITIPFGSIDPPWFQWLYGGGSIWGSAGLYWDVTGPGIDIPTLLYLVRKWKPSRSKAFVRVELTAGFFVTFTV